MKAVIQYVKHEDRTSRDGNPFTSCSIKVRGKFYNGRGTEQTLRWKVGQTVEVDLYEEEDKNGKLWGKFDVMEGDEMLLQRIVNLEARVNRCVEFLSKIAKERGEVAPVAAPTTPIEAPNQYKPVKPAPAVEKDEDSDLPF